GRGPHRLPARAGHQGPLPALRGRHAAARRAAAPAALGRVRRARRHQPAARGSRPARGVAGRHPRRRQGGLPAQRALADPDDRPRGAQRVRPGAHVRRQGHRLDALRHRRDQPPPREAGRVQHRARGRSAAAAQEHRRHPRPRVPRGRGHRGVGRRRRLGAQQLPRAPRGGRGGRPGQLGHRRAPRHLGHGPGGAGRPHPAAHRPDDGRGPRPAVRAGRTPARRDRRPQEGDAGDGRGRGQL
ncbi:MAG: Excinuclease ABC subunit B, partial [uncultured Actinomycetospora sp.]